MALGLLAALAAALAVQAAVVYKWTDADGVVHFSDQPVPGAEKIVTSASGSVSGSTRVGLAPATPSSAEPPKPKPEVLTFNQFIIISPGNEETISGNQTVNVRLALDPALRPTQSITWYLNGSPLSDQAPDATQFTLDDLPRGSYTLGATVVDQALGQSKSADSITFYVMRPSLLSPQHK
jgi:uncharacterized protein DUF4124